jgi:two-component system chemotaxis response regulator CheY
MTHALTILVVDDSAPMRMILGAILRAGGHEAMFAASVDAGLELMTRSRPDVVMTDYSMPGRNGGDLVRTARASGFEGPIFVVSSEKDPAIRAAMDSAGADYWLSKPVCAQTLLGALDAVRRTQAEISRLAQATVAACQTSAVQAALQA